LEHGHIVLKRSHRFSRFFNGVFTANHPESDVFQMGIEQHNLAAVGYRVLSPDTGAYRNKSEQRYRKSRLVRHGPPLCCHTLATTQLPTSRPFRHDIADQWNTSIVVLVSKRALNPASGTESRVSDWSCEKAEP
jgi:hypothetical protein